MRITKELYLPAPYSGVAVYASGQCYTTGDGLGLIESIRHESACRDRTRPHIPFPSRAIYRRLSEDNGRTWRTIGDVYEEDPYDLGGLHLFTPEHFQDPDNGRLISFYLTRRIDPSKRREEFSDEGINNRYQRPYYQISADGGRTWDMGRPLIHGGEPYDDVHWGPGLHYGRNGGGGGLGAFKKLEDGTLLSPFTVNLEDGKRYQSVFLRGRWLHDGSDLTWEFSDTISVSADRSSQGCCEPVPTLLDDGRIFVSLRCCGDRENQTFPSLKYWVMSDDGARTFSEPQPLTYEDKTPVWSPSSYAGIIRSSADRRTYWVGNILDEPTYGAYPRHPLCIAELIPEQGVLVRSSVIIIDTRPDDFPEENRRRYTNFGLYEDRATREIVLTLPEQPKVDWQDFTADCYRYRIGLEV